MPRHGGQQCIPEGWSQPLSDSTPDKRRTLIISFHGGWAAAALAAAAFGAAFLVVFEVALGAAFFSEGLAALVADLLAGFAADLLDGLATSALLAVLARRDLGAWVAEAGASAAMARTDLR